MIWGIIKFILTAIVFVYAIIGKLVDLMCKPFAFLLGKLKALFDRKMPIPERLNRKFSAFHGFWPFMLFAASLLFLIITILVNICNPETGEDYFRNLIFNTTIGSLAGFISGGFDLTPATLVAIAFASYLFSACVGTLRKESTDEDPEEWKAKFYIRIPCFLIYYLMSASLAYLLTGVFGAIGGWGYDAIVNLFSMENATVFSKIIRIIALIPMLYVALILLLIAVQEYAESVAFGIAGLLAMLAGHFLLQLLMKAFENPSPELFESLQNILVLVIFVGLEAVRPVVIKKFNNYLEDGPDDEMPESDENEYKSVYF